MRLGPVPFIINKVTSLFPLWDPTFFHLKWCLQLKSSSTLSPLMYASFFGRKRGSHDCPRYQPTTVCSSGRDSQAMSRPLTDKPRRILNRWIISQRARAGNYQRCSIIATARGVMTTCTPPSSSQLPVDKFKIDCLRTPPNNTPIICSFPPFPQNSTPRCCQDRYTRRC